MHFCQYHKIDMDKSGTDLNNTSFVMAPTDDPTPLYEQHIQSLQWTNMPLSIHLIFRFTFCFMSHSTARVILRQVVYWWRNQCIFVGQDSAL